jgi:hypothetical protein
MFQQAIVIEAKVATSGADENAKQVRVVHSDIAKANKVPV